MIAPRKALPKLLTSKLGTSAAASIIIKAFITNANKPNDRIDSGAVKNHKAGLIKRFISPSTMAAKIKARKFFALMPETNNVAMPRPTAVANTVINKAIIVIPKKFVMK